MRAQSFFTSNKQDKSLIARTTCFIDHSEEKNALIALHNLDESRNPNVNWFERLTAKEKERIYGLKSDTRLYQQLSFAFYPLVYGHEDINVASTSWRSKIGSTSEGVFAVGDPSRYC